MKVVILAGGKGSRISEESVLKPKPMVEIGDKPILWHIMKIYSTYGFHDFIICCGYKVTHTGELVIDPTEANIVFFIFHRFMNGDSLGEISDTVAREDIA